MALTRFYFSPEIAPEFKIESSIISSLGFVVDHVLRTTPFEWDIDLVVAIVRIKHRKTRRPNPEIGPRHLFASPLRPCGKRLTFAIDLEPDRVNECHNGRQLAELLAEVIQRDRSAINMATLLLDDQSRQFFDNLTVLLLEAGRTEAVWLRIGEGKYSIQEAPICISADRFSSAFREKQEFPRLAAQFLEQCDSFLRDARESRDRTIVEDVILAVNDFLRSWTYGHDKGGSVFSLYADCYAAVVSVPGLVDVVCQHDSNSVVRSKIEEFEAQRVKCQNTSLTTDGVDVL